MSDQTAGPETKLEFSESDNKVIGDLGNKLSQMGMLIGSGPTPLTGLGWYPLRKRRRALRQALNSPVVVLESLGDAGGIPAAPSRPPLRRSRHILWPRPIALITKDQSA